MVNTPVSNTSNFQRIVAPPETTRESGIQWYEVQQIAENNGVRIVGVTAESKEITRALFQIISQNELSFVISQNASRISGKLEIDLEKLTKTIYLDVDNQRVTISGESNNPEGIKVDGRIGLNTEKQTLLNQWSRIHQPLLDLSERTDPTDPTAKKSCWSCGLLGGAMVLSAGCCGYTFGTNVGCCAGVLTGGSIFVDECKGACASSRAASIKPEELSEAAVRAVLRAIEVRPVDKKDIFGSITLGIVYNPDKKRTGETVTIGVPQGLREGLTTDELNFLKSGGSLNNESFRKLTGKLTGNTRMGIKFANSLRQDFSGTMEQLFELTPDEQESVYIISQERPDGVDLIAQLLTEIFKQGSQAQIEISKDIASGSEGGSTARKVKFKLFVKAVCPPANPQNCNIEGGLEINF